ncbi:hypothetical protein M9H77_29744 [Catharanthus roseus]|uniref:Uncharacterized protein n=1 Tax=Catharanthus roseus TaxID=4058 RepID=A0ACB9ZVA1_CATRO|nr:hypothetical protein M9H77_29744 [Catharanthus roseus]
MRSCLEPQCLHKSIPHHVHPVVWRPACLMRLDRMGVNTLPKPKLSQHLVRHVRLDTIKIERYKYNIKHVIFKIYTSSSDKHPPSSFASARDACPRFLYRYASVAEPHVNLATKFTSFSMGQSLVGTMLPLLSLSSELPTIYCM